MKRILPILLLFLAAPALAVDLERAEVSAAFTPPHNEPVVASGASSQVARYKIEGDGSIRFWKRVTFDANLKFWFLQDWRTGEVVGHGFPEAWRNSDWNFERVRMDYNLRAGVDIYGPLQVFVEHNKWAFVSESVPEKVSDYYWMTGIRLRMR
jgi:hypothetical protein